MLTPVWTLISWPKVWLPAEAHRSLAGQIQHLSTTVNADKSAEGCVCGQVLFGWQSSKEMVGLAWDWVAIGGRILAMSDPLAIVSNVYFVAANGDTLQESARLVQLNDVINRLPWQRPVRRTLPPRTGSGQLGVLPRSAGAGERPILRAPLRFG